MANEESAFERLHTDASGVPGPRPGSGKEWLNSAPVVDKLICSFTTEMLDIVERGGDVVGRLTFECVRMNNLFLGITPNDRYDVGPWNRPDQLGEFISSALQINGETRLMVRDAFMWYADKVLKVFRGSSDFGEPEQQTLDALVVQLRDALLGLTGAQGFRK